MLNKFRIMFSIDELRKKILLTLGLLAVYRLGWNIILPMVNDQQGIYSLGGNMKDIFDRVAVFSGTQLDKMTIFGLGIMPYISSSIIFQLLGTVWAPLEKLRKEGESGQKKINEYTRYMTIPICLIQSYAYVAYLNSMAVSQFQSGGVQSVYLASCINPETGSLTMPWILLAVLTMTAGTAFLMWLGEQIDAYGIGNGISLLIMAGILARGPSAVTELWKSVAPDGHLAMGGGVEKIILLCVLFFLVVLGVVFIMRGQRRIPTQSAKHVRGRQVFGGNRQFLPLRVDQAGVMPIIFASSLMLFPQFIFAYLAGSFPYTGEATDSFMTKSIYVLNQMFSGSRSYIYVVMEIGLIYFFCYFWTAVTFNPKDMAENLKNHGTFIQGHRPGTRTADYLEKLMVRITYVGASFLAIIAVAPTLITNMLDVPYSIAGFFGGTSLLIAVSVVIDLVNKIDSHLVMRDHKGLLEK